MKAISGIRLTTGCLLMVSTLFFVPSLARAEDTPPPPAATIAVVDVDVVNQESVAMKSVRSQMEHFQQTYREQVTKEEGGLRSKQQELQKQAKNLTQEQMTEKARNFDQDVGRFRHKVELRSRALDKSYGQAMEQVNQAMIEVVRQVATTHGANIVLPRSQVMFFDEKMNITKEVIENLNKRLANVTVPSPKIEEDDGNAASNGGAKKKSQ